MYLRLVAFPESNRILRLHLLGALGMGTSLAVTSILPFLARQRFGATNWQTTVLTAAVPVMQFFSIFWNQLYARVPTRTYLFVLACLAYLPTGAIGLASNIWFVMVCCLLAALGNAGMSPLNADLLRSSYAPLVRGRVFGLVMAAQMTGAIVGGFVIGRWCDHDHNAYRIVFPLVAAIEITGLYLVRRVTSHLLFLERVRPAPPERGPWWSPFRDMRAILRADRRFAGYEVAFMSYGIGWMVCTALLPALATDRLHLDYSQYSVATVVIYQLTNLLMLAPAGIMADRMGSVRLAAISFLCLTVYPLALLAATGAMTLGTCSILYAIGMVGVQITWTLGPVALAQDPARASHYLAIHTTLVGVRGIIAQGLGMALYSLTGSFLAPLLTAAAAFFWAFLRMRRLNATPAPEPSAFRAARN